MIQKNSIPMAAAATETAPGRLAIRGFMATDPIQGEDTAAYSAITEWIAAQEPNAELVFDIDSGGGDISGVEALCAAIKNHPGPTKAIVTGTCGSAAYWVASACDKIEAVPSALIGSIGAMIPGALLQMDGDVVATLSPRKNAPDEQWQAVIDSACERFLAHVATMRRFPEKDFEAISKRVGEGKLMVASEALQRGLIDAISKEGGSMDPEKMPEVVTDEEKSVEETIRDLRAVIDDHERRIAECEAKLDNLKREGADEEIQAAEEKTDEEEKAAEAACKRKAAVIQPSARALASIENQLKAIYKTQREDCILRLMAEGKIANPSEAEIARNTYDTNRALFDRVYGRPAAMATVQRVSSGERARKAAAVDPTEAAWDAINGDQKMSWKQLYKNAGGK